MSAFLNALREEGTKEDCLQQIERLLDERDAALAHSDGLQRTMANILILADLALKAAANKNTKENSNV